MGRIGRTARPGAAALAAVAAAAAWGAGPASTSTPATGLAPQATAQAVRWTEALAGPAPCPEGSTRSATLLEEDFTAAIPQASFNDGWGVVTGAVDGRAARSTVGSTDAEDWFFTSWASAPVGARTMLGFATRGSVPDPAWSRADVNSVSATVTTGATWQGRVYDVTAATDDEQGRLGPWFQHRSAAGASQWWEVDNVQIYTCRPAPVSRLRGTDRYDTSAAVASQYPAGQDVVYLAQGLDFADALAGAALAGRDGAPVLLVRKDTIPSRVAAQLDRLDPSRVVVLGGPEVVSDAVVAAAAARTTTGEVTRLAGTSRWGTAAAIASTYPSGVGTVYVASGLDYPDGLSGGAAAGRLGSPLLLTRPDVLPLETQAALDRLAPGAVVIVGGPGAVSSAVMTQLRDHTSGTVSRIAGIDRYETAARVAATFPAGPRRTFVATGTAFPDALSASALAGAEATPVLLTKPQALPATARTALDRLGAGAGVVLGGYNAVQSTVLDQLGQRVG